MVQFMFAHVINAILTKVSVVNYVVFTCDEVNTMDNGSWICDVALGENSHADLSSKGYWWNMS